MAKVIEGSVWDAGVKIPRFPALSSAMEVDVAIVGGGITGISAAYLLSQAGLSVVVVEKDQIGWGATGVTTAFLTQYLDTSVAELIAMFGLEETKAILSSHSRAITAVEEIVTAEQLDCEFTRCPNYMYAQSEKDTKFLLQEEYAAKSLGLQMKFQPPGELSFSKEGCLKLLNQAKFHPLKYLSALVGILQQRGVKIFENTEVQQIQAGTPVTLVTDKADIKAKHVLVATYAPFDKKLFFKKAFYTSYVYELSVPTGRIEEATYEDTANPYHYFRVDKQGNKDRLIVGGADHRSDVPIDPSKNWQAMTDFLQTTFSGIPYEIVRRWSGPIVESTDGLAFIGPVDHKNIFYATGFSGNGMTYAFIAAKIFADQVVGRKNEWSSLYNARRIPRLKHLMYKGQNYLEELWGGAIMNSIRYSKEEKKTMK